MSRFAPVYLPDDRKLAGRISQTALRHFNGCPRSAYLYLLNKGEARTSGMERGRALHAVAEQMTRTMIEHGEVTIPADIAKVIVDEVFADSAFHVPFEEQDYVREACYRLASEWAIDPSTVIACETLFALEIDGLQVRAKIDFAELLEDGAAVHVVDFKSARGAPSFEEISRKLADGRLMARSFQLVLYALVLAFGVPVRVEGCGECSGLGMESGESPELSDRRFSDPFPHVRMPRTPSPEQSPCPACGGSGRIEIPEPFPVASHAQRFDLEYVYPGIEDREGRMLRRPITLTRAELVQYRASLEGLVARVRAAEGSGDWPAVVSDAACSECPASALCPIPAELRDHRGSINTVEQAAEALEVRHREKDVARAKSRELREFVKRHGAVRYGNGMVAEIGYSTSEQIRDKAGFMDAVERTARYGEPLERHRYVKTVELFPLVERPLTVEELAEEVEDGREEDGRGGSLDERFGAGAPW